MLVVRLASPNAPQGAQTHHKLRGKGAPRYKLGGTAARRHKLRAASEAPTGVQGLVLVEDDTAQVDAGAHVGVALVDLAEPVGA